MIDQEYFDPQLEKDLYKFYNKIHQFQPLRYCKLVILGTLGMPSHPCQHDSISL